jgi:hypothetical protein
MDTEKDSGVKHTHLGSLGGGYSFQKGPTDYLFSVNLVLQNVVDGSRWRVELASDGTLIDTGVQSGTGDITVSIGYAGSAFNVRIKVRKASGGTLYKPFETQAQITASGASSYVIQQVD